jgi:reactive intermediate/imine deaminase
MFSMLSRTLLGACLISSTALAQLPEKVIVKSETHVPHTRPYSDGVLVGNTLYLSGQGSARPDGSMPENMEGEIRQCFENVRNVLLGAGMGLPNVVSAYVFLEDLDNYQLMNKVFREYFPTDPPVRSTIEVGQVPGDSRIEVQTIAVQDGTPKEIIQGAEGQLFSPGIKINNLLYMSGKGTQIPGKDGASAELYKHRVRQAILNVGSVLEAAGLDYRHVVFTNPYIMPPNLDWGPMNLVYRQFFTFGRTPARATITMSDIPGASSDFELSAVAVTDLRMRRVIYPKSRKPSPTASPAVMAGHVLYSSALSGFIPGQGKISDRFEDQLHLAMRNVLDVLETAGMNFDNVVSVNCYLRNIEDYGKLNEIYATYFPMGYPARTTLQPNPDGDDSNSLVQFSVIAVKSVTERPQQPPPVDRTRVERYRLR